MLIRKCDVQKRAVWPNCQLHALSHLPRTFLSSLAPSRLSQLGPLCFGLFLKARVVTASREAEIQRRWLPHTHSGRVHRPHRRPAGSPKFSGLIHDLTHRLRQKKLLSPLRKAGGDCDQRLCSVDLPGSPRPTARPALFLGD